MKKEANRRQCEKLQTKNRHYCAQRNARRVSSHKSNITNSHHYSKKILKQETETMLGLLDAKSEAIRTIWLGLNIQ